MDLFIFIVLTTLGIIFSGGVLFVKGGPGIVGICGAAIPLICGTPVAIFLFANPAFKQKFQGIRRSILPALIPIVFASLFFGVLMYDQNPKVTFKRLLSDPIPEGVSNIRSYDNSGGLDVEYGLAFEATPEVIDYLIKTNELELNTDDFNFNILDAPFEHFPDVNPNQEWLYYSKEDKENENEWFLWVNADKNIAMLKFIGY
jgi:hypothetical protein